jgi:hypothetical protein
MTDLLEQIIAAGNRSFDPVPAKLGNNIRCADGFRVSVIAGEGAYCSPRPNRYAAIGDTHTVRSDFPGPYLAVEVGFPSERPEPWAEWSTYADSVDEPTKSVYGYVPVELVRALIARHGGEA